MHRNVNLLSLPPSLPAAMLGSPGSSLQASISAVGPPSASSITSTTHIDPSSMQRAYAALGLPYGNQSPGQQTPQGPQHQQLRSLNALGTTLTYSPHTAYTHTHKLNALGTTHVLHTHPTHSHSRTSPSFSNPSSLSLSLFNSLSLSLSLSLTFSLSQAPAR